jgi:uncharacterized protein YhdP
MLRRIVKWLLWCLAVLFFILAIGAVALWLTPRAVSTNWSKRQLETRASRALQAPVTVDGLQWTWEDGIRMQGLRIADDKAFSRDPIISLERLILTVDPGQLIDRRLYLDLQIEGLKARLIRGTDGRTNLEASTHRSGFSGALSSWRTGRRTVPLPFATSPCLSMPPPLWTSPSP